MAAALRAYFGYIFLVMLVRIVGRRPGRQLTPFEYVLIFFIGGLALTAIVGDELSFVNALCQILAIGSAHFTLTWCRAKSSRFARIIDGTPLLLFRRGAWREETLTQMRISKADVLAAARDHDHWRSSDIESALLERAGEISVLASRSGVAGDERGE